MRMRISDIEEMNGIRLSDYDIDIHVVKDGYGKIASGFVIGDILSQNQALILQTHKGEWKEDPSIGVGISDMLLDENLELWKREIREQMELDGQTVTGVTITYKGITIEASYE